LKGIIYVNWRFFLNGGLFGVLRGFDHKEEGRPYGFEEFGEDVQKASEPFMEVSNVLSSINVSSNLIGNYAMEDQDEE